MKAKNNKKAAGDIVLFAAAVSAALLIYLFQTVGRPAGSTVKILLDGEIYAVLPLNENAELSVDGRLTVIIKNMSASVANADCPDKLCEKRGEISKSGEVIACLPNGITVTVAGEDKDGEFDFIH